MTPKVTIDFDGISELPQSNGEVIIQGIAMLVKHCHAASYNRGWWHDPITGLSLIPGDLPAPLAGFTNWPEKLRETYFPYVIATKIALIHSEVSEGLEAFRTDEMDDKIPFRGITAEMGDAVIRIADLVACLQEQAQIVENASRGEADERAELYDLGAAIMAKIPYNAVRSDHDFSSRKKKF